MSSASEEYVHYSATAARYSWMTDAFPGRAGYAAMGYGMRVLNHAAWTFPK
jgi:hypothetical protein